MTTRSAANPKIEELDYAMKQDSCHFRLVGYIGNYVFVS